MRKDNGRIDDRVKRPSGVVHYVAQADNGLRLTRYFAQYNEAVSAAKGIPVATYVVTTSND